MLNYASVSILNKKVILHNNVYFSRYNFIVIFDGLNVQIYEKTLYSVYKYVCTDFQTIIIITTCVMSVNKYYKYHQIVCIIQQASK